jgi:MoaA/NifB/PqqE/SkfB family radical SAM enzyme
MSPFGATPRPEEGVVSWNINTACNYRCSYCTQRFKEDRGRWSRDTPRFIEAFARLPGRWEIKLSGGEPFVHPTLLAITEGLAKVGHRISVVTNFSASRDKLVEFASAAAGRVGVFSASLHLEYVGGPDLDAFITKASWMEGELRARARSDLPAPHVCVTSVATREALPGLPAIAARFHEAGVTFKVQPEKQDRDVISYAPSEREALLSLGGHNLTGRIEHRYQGLPCWAGSRYFILDDTGQAYRCYPARRYKIERMGDFLSPDFRLEDGPSPCLYKTCNCTVPIARKMMPVELGR